MLCILNKIQASENGRISGRLKILNTISRKKMFKKQMSFLRKDTKQKFQRNLFL